MPIVRGRFRDDRFNLVSNQVAGEWTKQVTVECYSCATVGATGVVAEGSHKVQAIHAEQAFRARGWSIGPTPKKTLCPVCKKLPAHADLAVINPPSPPLAPLPPQPERPLGPLPELPELPPKAEPPREPTVAERRRIVDALDEHYNIDNALYRQSWSDTALAAKLNLPRAWVTDIRTLLFGKADANENSALKLAAVERLEVRLREVTEEVMTRLVSVETELAKLRAGM
jgi:ribosome-binding protein aMBF1 (putative translation factor)